MKIATLVVVGVGLALATSRGFAHHSFSAEFDSTKPVKLTGTVTKVEWTNPHAWFYLDVKDDHGVNRKLGHGAREPQRAHAQRLEPIDDESRRPRDRRRLRGKDGGQHR